MKQGVAKSLTHSGWSVRLAVGVCNSRHEVDREALRCKALAGPVDLLPKQIAEVNVEGICKCTKNQ